MVAARQSGIVVVSGLFLITLLLTAILRDVGYDDTAIGELVATGVARAGGCNET